MRVTLWAFDTVTVDLEDRDVTVIAVHKISCAEITIKFRLTEGQLGGDATTLKSRLEVLASEHIHSLSSFLDSA